MAGFMLFALALLGLALLAVGFYVKRPREFFRSRAGRGVAFGIALAVVIPLALAFLASQVQALEYLSSAEVFAGLEETRKISPMCDTGPNTDRLTSNLGARVSVLRSDDKRADVRLTYTHHSCAFNPDAKSYDALGVQVTYTIFRK